MKYPRLILFIGVLMFHTSPALFAQSLEVQFERVLDSTYKVNTDAIGIMMHIEAPDKNISWSYAVGVSQENTEIQLDNDQPVLIASITKTYVATSIMKLVEAGTIQLDDPIKKLVHKKTKKKLVDNGYDLKTITVKHLLSHTSGITDYVNKSYFNTVDTDPQHQWTRDEQIDLAVVLGPYNKPGLSYEYGDINFLLLSEILERKTKMPFYQAIRELLEFEKNNLNTTWFISLETTPEKAKALAHQYSKKHGWDSYDINPSFDLYGGGGIAANTKDVALFFQLLFDEKIIKDKNILSQMYTYVLPKEEANNYGLGLFHLPSFHGYKAYYHGGWWGTDVIHIPELNCTIAAFTLEKGNRNLNSKISGLLLNLLKN